MADNRVDIPVNITGNAESLIKALNEATGALRDAKKNNEESKAGFEEVATVAVEAYAVLKEVIFESVNAFYEAEKAQKQLTQALRANGLGTANGEYKEYAENLSKLIGIDKAAAESALARGQVYLGNTKATDELVRATANFSAATGHDFIEIYEKATRTIGTNTDALKKLGVQVVAGTGEHDRLNQVIGEFNRLAPNQAEASQTGEIHFKRLAVAVKELQEKLGKELAPALEDSAKAITQLVTAFGNDSNLVSIAAKIAQIVGGFLGAVTVVASLKFAMDKLAIVWESLAVEGTVLGEALIALTGPVGLLVAAVLALLATWRNTFATMDAVIVGVKSTFFNFANGIDTMINGVLMGDLRTVKAGFLDLFSAFSKGAHDAKEKYIAEYNYLKGKSFADAVSGKEAVNYGEVFGPSADLASGGGKIKKPVLESVKAEQELVRLEVEKASKERIALKQQEISILKKIEAAGNEEIRQQLRQSLSDIRREEEEARVNEQEAKKVYYGELLASNEDFQQLNGEQLRRFAEQNFQADSARIITEKNARYALAQDQLKIDIDTNNKFQKEKLKYGTTIATIDKELNTKQVVAAKAVSGELVQLTQSRNETLKSIGKAAAVTQITIATAEAATSMAAKITEAVPFPFNIPVIAAFVGARLAFGAEQISNVLAANEGGIVPGHGPNQDSVRSYLTPGELVVPRNNFDEVVNAVAARRSGQGNSGDSADVVNAIQSLAQKLDQPRALAIEARGNVSDSLIQWIAQELSNAIEFKNVRIVGVNA